MELFPSASVAVIVTVAPVGVFGVVGVHSICLVVALYVSHVGSHETTITALASSVVIPIGVIAQSSAKVLSDTVVMIGATLSILVAAGDVQVCVFHTLSTISTLQVVLLVVIVQVPPVVVMPAHPVSVLPESVAVILPVVGVAGESVQLQHIGCIVSIIYVFSALFSVFPA